MKLTDLPFQTLDWSTVAVEEHPGDVGVARWRTLRLGELRVRMVEYSPGYTADHWCSKGHLVLCLSGELHTTLADGRTVVLRPQTSYFVGDDTLAHRSSAPLGALLYIVD